MRPTFLNFRSPKDITPDFYCPRVTIDGNKLLEHSYQPPGVKVYFKMGGVNPKKTSKSPFRTIKDYDP